MIDIQQNLYAFFKMILYFNLVRSMRSKPKAPLMKMLKHCIRTKVDVG